MSQRKFSGNDGNEEKYKIETICNNTVYAKVSKSDYLPCL